MFPIQRLTQEIDVLNAPERNEVFVNAPSTLANFSALLKRSRELTKLRELYYQRAICFKSGNDFRAAAQDYYRSAQLGYVASIRLFLRFGGEQLRNYFRVDSVPLGMDAETAFMSFLLSSLGLGCKQDRTVALTHFVYAAKLGHPDAKTIADHLDVFLQCLRASGHGTSSLTHVCHDKVFSARGNYNFHRQHTIPAFDVYQESAKLGNGSGFHGLACMYFYGVSQPVNIMMGLRYFTLAVETGHLHQLPLQVYPQLRNLLEHDPNEGIAFLNAIVESGLIASIDFRENLAKMFDNSSYSWCCWSSSTLDQPVQDKLHELLALCEIKQFPSNTNSGLRHMSKIGNLSNCLPKNLEAFVNFHRDTSQRAALDGAFWDLIKRFEVASGVVQGEFRVRVRN